MSASPPMLRIGLFTDSGVVAPYIYDFAKWSSQESGIENSALILLGEQNPETGVTFVFRLFEALEARLLALINRAKGERRGQHFVPRNVSELFKHVLPMNCRTGDHVGQQIAPDDVARIQELELDIVVSVGDRPPPVDLARLAKHGVMLVQPGDSHVPGGWPVGFWEVYQRCDTTSFAIEQHVGAPCMKVVLKWGSYPTQFAYLQNRSLLFSRAYFHMRLLIKQLSITGELPHGSDRAPYAPISLEVPSLKQCGFYFIKFLSLLFTKSIYRMLNYQIRWSVSYVRQDWPNAVFGISQGIPNPPGRYLADPFGVRWKGRSYCFVEDYVCRTKRGHISVCEIDESDNIKIATCVKENFHLSFPFVFSFEGELYMCPESSENQDIRLYRCIDFPTRWNLDRILMKDVCAADTMIFEHGGKWWMFTNIDPMGARVHCSELYIFHAISPLSTHWTPHALNPVLTDARGARNGGLLMDGHRIFRVGQEQGFDTYGQGLSVFEIDTLSETEFLQKRVCSIEASYKKGIFATHHLSSEGEMTFIDHAKRSFMR